MNEEIEFIQTQNNFIDVNEKFYKHLVYSFDFGNNRDFDYNMRIGNFNTKKSYMKDEPISTTDRWLSYEQEHSKQSAEDILELISNNQKNIAKLRGNPIISYLTDISTLSFPEKTNISDEDKKEFISLIRDIPQKYNEIDVILHSNGGYIESARHIVNILRDRFEKVNFLIPFAARSAASMMCMSADEIIMTPEASLGPFDVHIKSPVSGEYLPVDIILKEAKKAYNPFNIFYFKSSFKGWDKNMAEKTIEFCKVSEYRSKIYPLYWLMKYMFKVNSPFNEFFTKFLLVPIWKRFTIKGIKARIAVYIFIKYGKNISHDVAIMSDELKGMWLNVSKAENSLLCLMRETYQLSDKLFERSTIQKLYISDTKSFFKYIREDEEKNPRLV